MGVQELRQKAEKLRQEYEALKKRNDPRWRTVRVQYLNVQADVLKARKVGR